MKRAEEKELARQAREDQREQEKLEREIREARARIDKERRHFAGAMQKLQLRLASAQDEQERKDLQARLIELEQQNGALDEEERLSSSTAIRPPCFRRNQASQGGTA